MDQSFKVAKPTRGQLNRENEVSLQMHPWYVHGHHITYSKSKYQPGKIANPARGQLNINISLSRWRLRIWSRETVSAVPSRVSLLISILRLDLVLTSGIPPDSRGGVHLFN